MSKSNQEKKRLKRKALQKERRAQISHQIRREKEYFYFQEAIWHRESRNYDMAETFLKKALKINPGNRELLMEMARLGAVAQRYDLLVLGIGELRNKCLLGNTPPDNEILLDLVYGLIHQNKYQLALDLCREIMAGFSQMKVHDSKKYKKKLLSFQKYASDQIQWEELRQKLPETREILSRLIQKPKKTGSENVQKTKKTSAPATDTKEADTYHPKERHLSLRIKPLQTFPEIPIILTEKGKNWIEAFAGARFSSKAVYDLVMEAMQIRMKETFDHLLCLRTLSGVSSLIYQEETARKILKTFRGRALLADEVGMGKTIEACMVLKEYMMRQMVKSVLILAPTPLVSQWREELKTKFNLDFLSTDDPGARTEGERFWEHPQIVASINIAKSVKNFHAVTAREYDLVIVDEAHHLKNRNTLNWRLVNSLKKRFLLLLTATPVENNLLELYNLITLLKPGQLKTISEFKEAFMTKGDPTDPKNREQLKGLLNQVMIRNTRAVSNIQIPPRFAETIRIAPTPHETELYQRVSDLVRDINQSDGTKNKMVLKHLLAEAGSSPAAVEKTLVELMGKSDLTNAQTHEIQAIRNLCRSMGNTGKNAMTLKLFSASNEKMIIFVKYRATLDHVSEMLSWHGISHSLFHGQMSNAKKDEEIENFKSHHPILVTTELGGEGRNLQFCRRMINYDLPWNPMRIEQRIGRIHRIGQEKEVLIYNLCGAGTVEDYILEILDKKINMFEMVIGEIDMILGRLRGEQEFSDRVYDIWVNSVSEKERRESFEKLGAQLKKCKTGYEKTKSLDEKLFGENYEL